MFDELLARREIVVHASDVERTRRLAAEASVGKLVVADTREQVARVNTFAHRIRKATGEVDERVLTAAGERVKSATFRGALTRSGESLFERYGSTDSLASKGVHATVMLEEAEFCALHTYLLAGEVLLLAEATTPED